MAAPGKAASLDINEKVSTPSVAPVTTPKKQRDMSHSSPALPPTPTAKTHNPDLGAQEPVEPPTPALAKYGVHMPITKVNDKVAAIAQAHQAKFGYTPSPGLVFDILKATPMIGDTPDFNHLFGVTSQRDATTQRIASVNPQTMTPDALVVHHISGVLQKPLPPQLAPLTLHQLEAKYPTVQMGMIPLPGAEGIYSAIDQMFKQPGTLTVASEGQTFAQAAKEAEYAAGSVEKGYEAAYHSRRLVQTVTDAQTHMNQMMGTHLPVTGFFNPDWQKAWADYTKTKAYFQRALNFQAKQAGLSVPTYLKAFKAKTESVKKHGGWQYFLNALPLTAFSHGSNPLSVFEGIVTGPFANPSLSIDYPLHALTRTAGTTLHVIGGSVEQGKADAAAGNAFFVAIEPKWIALSGEQGQGETLDQAKEKAKRALVANPSWLRVFYPTLPEHETGKLKALDELTNFAGDIILLRKATFTGEAVRAGDVTVAQRSTYLQRASRYAYEYLKEGKLGRATAMLEGGPGAERLAAAAHKAIVKGRMSPEQFQQHVAELYANGHTKIEALPKENPNHVNVYHGTTYSFDQFRPNMGENSGASLLGTKGIYFSEDAKAANTYTDFSARGGRGEAPNVRLNRLDQSKMFDWSFESDRAATPAKVAKIKSKIEGVLTSDELQAVQTTEHGGIHTWSSAKNPQEVYRQLVESFKGGDTTFKVEQKALDQAAQVLERAGYKGIISGDAGKRQFYVFDTKDILPRFEQPVVVPVDGSVLHTLRGAGKPTPTAVSVVTHKVIRDGIDRFDQGLRAGGRPGTYAADFTSWLRSEFGHAAPRSPRAYFDPQLPERVHDFTLRHFGDAGLANDMESALIRARAAGNVPKIQKIESQLQRLYFKKYSVGAGLPREEDPFTPLLSTEAGSRFHFPAGNRQPINDPFTAISATSRGITGAFAKVAAIHRRLLILSPSLFYKHAVGDTLRRIIGGDNMVLGDLKGTKGAIKGVINGDSKMAREYGSFLDRVTNGEAYYMAAPGERSVTFDTGSKFGSGQHMEAAGADLRRMLDDNALHAYHASTADDLKPLVDLIKSDPIYRRLWSAQQRAAAIRHYGEDTMRQGVHIVNVFQSTVMSRKEMMAVAMPVERYAEQLFNRYRKVEEAARAKNQTLDDALNVLRDNRGGHADKALGQWISSNGIDYKVEKALVADNYSFDTVTAKLVGKIMHFNKANRHGFAENMAASNFKALKQAGWDDSTALRASMDIAEKQVVYHMLDFANMLQVEQDLRWLSYFLTKHRLYWKWAASTMVRQPGLPALIGDINQHLDDNGNLNFSLFGHALQVPAARLVWVQNKEYPESSPFALGLKGFLANGFSVQAGANAAAGALGTGINRNSSSATLVTKLTKMELGKTPATYTNALSGLNATDQVYLQREMNHYNSDYYSKHGHFAPQAEVVKHSLAVLAAQNFWRSNLPLPIVPVKQPNDIQKLIDQAMRIPNPQKRSKFFSDHPEVTAAFGVSKNPVDYQHSRTFFDMYNQARDQYLQAREEIYQNATKTGHMTIEMEQQKAKIGNSFSKVFDQLKAKDLAQTPVARRKEVNGEQLGLWGQQISADPLINPEGVLHKLFPNVPVGKLNNALPGRIVAQAEQELKLLKDPVWVAKTFADPAEARTRTRELLQVIQDFRAYPHDALGAIQDQYQQKHVNAYWSHVTAANVQIAKLGRGAKDLAYANLRQWKDEQDHPVVVNGVTFPSPIKLAWADMPPDVRAQRIAALATGSWDHLADYEKELLGLKPAPGTSEGWDALLAAKKNYAHQQNLAGKSPTLQANQITAIVKQIGLQRPGFLKDWKFKNEPSVKRFEATVLYKDMPKPVKEFWDTSVKPNAEAIAAALADHKTRTARDRAQLNTVWQDAVAKQFMPAINTDPVLKKWFTPYLTANPDFLNSLVK